MNAIKIISTISSQNLTLRSTIQKIKVPIWNDFLMNSLKSN